MIKPLDIREFLIEISSTTDFAEFKVLVLDDGLVVTCVHPLFRKKFGKDIIHLKDSDLNQNDWIDFPESHSLFSTAYLRLKELIDR